jgi:hypothetical protein
MSGYPNLSRLLKAKGDLLVRGSSSFDSILGVGADGFVLTADSAQALGVKWAAAAGGVTDHGALTGLTPDDDHTQYARLAGRAGDALIIDTVNEQTLDNGVSVEGVTLKDGNILIDTGLGSQGTLNEAGLTRSSAALVQFQFSNSGAGLCEVLIDGDPVLTNATRIDELAAAIDNTSLNVTSAAHGLAPKSPGSATQFLNGAATPAFAAVKDSDLSTTDITTNDVTASKHGFFPKLPGGSTNFWREDGTWQPAGGGSGLTQAQVFARISVGF